MALKSGTTLHIQSVGHTKHVNLDTDSLGKDRLCEPRLDIIPIENPNNLSGKLQGENIAV